MSTRSFKTARRIAFIAFTASAAYLGAHLAGRAANANLAELSATVGTLAHQVKIDYWSVYADVQRDLLLNEEEDQAQGDDQEGS